MHANRGIYARDSVRATYAHASVRSSYAHTCFTGTFRKFSESVTTCAPKYCAQVENLCAVFLRTVQT